MYFLSAGASKLQDKVNAAQDQMFLLTDDVPMLDANSTAKDVVSAINASRSFCFGVDDQGAMSCVRAAGWKSNRLYYNYVPVLNTQQTIDAVSASKNISFFDMFARYYSIGREGLGSIYDGVGSVLGNTSQAAFAAPAGNCMILPAFDATASSAGLNTNPNTALTLSSSSSWNTTTSLGIVTGRYTQTITTFMTQTQISGIDIGKDQVTVAKSVVSISGTSYGAGAGPRLLSLFTQNQTIGRSPYSESIISNTTTNSYGPRMSTTNVADNNLLYGTGSKADTGDYGLAWAIMPISTDQNSPQYAVVLRSGEDFTQQGLATPGVKPVLSRMQKKSVSFKTKFLM